MGLVNHPRLFDTATMNLVTETFHEVWATVEGRNPILTADEDRPNWYQKRLAEWWRIAWA